MNFIELFAGVGGLSEGFIEAGFKPIAYIEKDKYCCDTLKTRLAFFELRKLKKLSIYRNYLLNKITRDELYQHIPPDLFSTVIHCEINQSTFKLLLKQVKGRIKRGKVDVLLGGPPCQAFSLIGRAQNRLKTKDSRIYLYKYYLQFLKELKPTVFVFENVPGLLSIQDGVLFKKIISKFKKIGYYVDFKVLNSKNYGILQNRKRLIVCGSLNHAIELKNITCTTDSYSVKDILYDLKTLKPGDMANTYTKKPKGYLLKHKIRLPIDVLTQHTSRPHNDKDLAIYKIAITKWKENQTRLRYSDLPPKLISHNNISTFLDRFKVVGDNLAFAHTLMAHIAKDGHYYIHPDLKQCRSISVREAARIQSFPDNFYFEGPRTAQFTQIGNAVPPLLSGKIAKLIIKSRGGRVA